MLWLPFLFFFPSFTIVLSHQKNLSLLKERSHISFPKPPNRKDSKYQSTYHFPRISRLGGQTLVEQPPPSEFLLATQPMLKSILKAEAVYKL